MSHPELAVAEATQIKIKPNSELQTQTFRAEKNYRKVVELSSKVARFDARFAKLRAYITQEVGDAVVKGHANPRSYDLVVLRNTVRMMKGKKPLRGI